MGRLDGTPSVGRAAGVRDPHRRTLVLGTIALVASAGPLARAASGPIRFGLTPVFLSNDIELLSLLEAYLERATGRPVQLVTRRTYQEITALLVSARLDAAWICGYPFIAYRNSLDLVAVPVWRGDTYYQSYLIARADRQADAIEDLAGDVHAFSDPDSNSGYLVTRALLAEKGLDPETFFGRTIFTYGHRNVVRAVASGLAHSGSVDGYVLEVLKETEPGLAEAVRVVRKSERLGFPPVAAPKHASNSDRVKLVRQALLAMSDDPAGRNVLSALRLDGFEERPESLFDAIAAKVELVRKLG